MKTIIFILIFIVGCQQIPKEPYLTIPISELHTIEKNLVINKFYWNDKLDRYVYLKNHQQIPNAYFDRLDYLAVKIDTLDNHATLFFSEVVEVTSYTINKNQISEYFIGPGEYHKWIETIIKIN